jgi:hypothetical protein
MAVWDGVRAVLGDWRITYLGSAELSATASSGRPARSAWSLLGRLSGPTLPLRWLATSRSRSRPLSVLGRDPVLAELFLRREKACFRDLLMACLPVLTEGGRFCGGGVEAGCRSDVCDMNGDPSSRRTSQARSVLLSFCFSVRPSAGWLWAWSGREKREDCSMGWPRLGLTHY